MATETSKPNKIQTNYAKIGIIAAVVVAVAAVGIWGVSKFHGGIGSQMSISDAISGVSTKSVSGSELRIAVIRMDDIQGKATVLASLNKQKDGFTSRLRDDLNAAQKSLETEKSDIEKSQGVLSQDALQRRIAAYQQKVGALQKSISDRAQAIEAEYQKALAQIQKDDLDPIINAIIAKKNLSIVLDGRFARVAENAPVGLDITDDVTTALNKRISDFRMGTPAGF
ncbi:MAG: OmpH family outer membrane protein [Proteobacteria bacterium]|nr:OmpH family outer membrane protein [Pseudomonadota bacterium]